MSTHDRPTLVLLFAGEPPHDAARLAADLRGLHPDFAAVEVDWSGDGTEWLGRVVWGEHEVTLVSVAAPPPAELLEQCVDPAHYLPPLKERARASRSHLILGYAGRTSDAVEAYAMTAAVASVAGQAGATTVLNEVAHTSVPYEVIVPQPDEGDTLELLRQMPVPMLYGGFVKLEVERLPGVWMRTRGHHLLGLPDLALRAAGHHEGDLVFDVFTYVVDYLRSGAAEVRPGDTLAVGPELTYLLREPKELEFFLESEGPLWVLEPVAD
jgi:hypothetical protein